MKRNKDQDKVKHKKIKLDKGKYNESVDKFD